MKLIDVFNGDADGICALHQLRLVYPAQSVLVTGVKRDTALLERVQASPHDTITVLDLSLDRNRQALIYLLDLGTQVLYFDHHYAGEIPKHSGLRAMIHTEPMICTSALVDQYLGGAHRAWAVVAAYGDNLEELAKRLAQPLRLDAGALAQLRELGECLNYNAYGDSEADLFFHPANLFRTLSAYSNPLHFVAHESRVMEVLRRGRKEDLALATQVAPQVRLPKVALYVLPEGPWSRRVRGDFANDLSRRHPERVHAVLTHNAMGGYTVSVRASLVRAGGADQFCLHFETGGGRAQAAGVNHLPEAKFNQFVSQFIATFGE